MNVERGNRLAAEASLYLRQHAQNPVDWHPWGEEALERARREDKPIFLSIGYSSCHWCHVMEHEVFEDDGVAAVLNAKFVCIKVDREERPDIDAAYMDALQAMTGSGGWPMSLFLTPGLEPFYGGTYIPRDGFLQLIERIDLVFREKRDELQGSAAEVSAAVNRRPPGGQGEPPDAEALTAAARKALAGVDPAWGGFGGRQKFPTPPRWRFLLHHYRKTGDEDAARALRLTLDRMADGGIRDQIGGGFHRYAVEPTWLVPHFEIMLYDNAQLASLYLEASAALDEPRYRETALDVLDFLAREMRDPAGGFHASFDADSEGGEGRFYVWTPGEIEQIAGAADGPALAAVLGVTEEGNFEGRSIPTRRADIEDVARRFGRDPGELGGLFAEHREALRERRGRRSPPALDPKIVTAWNGLAIGAFAAAHAVTGENRYLRCAEDAAEFLWRAHRGPDGRLIRSSSGGVSGAPAIIDDYAFLADGLLELHQAAGDPRHLERALELLATAREAFRDDDGTWYLTAADAEAPLGRRVDLFDSVEPAGASALVRTRLRAAALTGDGAMREEAVASLAAHAGLLERAGMEMAWWLDASLLLAGPFYEVVVAGDRNDAAARDLARIFTGLQPPHAVLVRVPAAGADSAAAALMPPSAGKTAPKGRAAAYVCRFGSCNAPVADPGDLRRDLLAGWFR